MPNPRIRNVKNFSPTENSSKQTDGQADNFEKTGKDTKSRAAMENRADKWDDDPFLTEQEKENDDTKEKTEKTDDVEKSNEDLGIILNRAEKILFKANAFFPFDIFPDTITIDANKVNVIQRTFFYSETATSILLKEIMDVRVESALFLARLIIDYGPHPLKVSTVIVPKLHRKDALKAKEIIEGVLVLYRSENVNTTNLQPEETLEEVKEIGKIEERE